MDKKQLIYLLCDVSDILTGEVLAVFNSIIQGAVSAMLNDPTLLETAWVSVITYSDSARQLVQPVDLFHFSHVPLAGSGKMSNLGEALKFVGQCADRDMKNSPEPQEDGQPFVLILTDSKATDNIEEGLCEFNKRKWYDVMVCCGSNADINELSRITKTIVSWNTIDGTVIRKFLKIPVIEGDTYSPDEFSPGLPPDIHIL